MKTVYNFRSFADHQTVDGKILVPGLLYRSGDLDKIKGRDLLMIESLGIKTIIDLRSKEEYRSKKQGILGAIKHSIPIDLERLSREKLSPLLHRKNSEEKIISALDAVYDEMLNFFSGSIKRIFNILEAEDAYPVLIHCRAGKDRTGFLSALILLSIGIQKESVVADYLKSNSHLIPVVNKKLKKLKWATLNIFPTHNIETALTVREQFLERVLLNMQEEYGGVEGYLESCGVGADSINRLVHILLCDGA